MWSLNSGRVFIVVPHCKIQDKIKMRFLPPVRITLEYIILEKSLKKIIQDFLVWSIGRLLKKHVLPMVNFSEFFIFYAEIMAFYQKLWVIHEF